MRVSLPMYNLPEMQAANTQFWQAIRTESQRAGLQNLPENPDHTRKPVPAEIEPDTLFTQVCGWPLQTIYAGQAQTLGIPCYDAPYCDGPTHAGVFIVHQDSPYQTLSDLEGCHFVFNSRHSNSGMNLPRRAIAALAPKTPFFQTITETGSQPQNLERVARQEADATCVDTVTQAFFTRHRPALAAHLRILAPTPPTPAIPFVTSTQTPPQVRAALSAALTRVAQSPEWAETRAALLLQAIHPATAADYAIPVRYAAEAVALGYAVLT